MLPNSRRLTRKTFLVVSGGKSTHSPCFTFRFVKNDQKLGRFSVVVSKKVAKSATERNRIRRRMYEAIRKTHLQGKDGIFYMRKESVALPFHTLVDEVKKL